MVALIALRVMNKNGYSTGVLWTGRVGGAAWVAPKACRRMYDPTARLPARERPCF